MNGIIVLDKPQGFTSFDAIAVLRGITREKKIGHTGTLDPMATGVLPVLLGRAAKAAELIENNDKEYIASFSLGKKTDTGDITGKVIEQCSKKARLDELEKAAKKHRGNIMQTPPMYSAVSVNGQRLYKLARQGIEIERQPREVEIKKLEIVDFDEERQEGKLQVLCSKGTYIRTLIEDIAACAQTLGVMTNLRRTGACGFTIENSVTLETLKENKNEIERYIIPTDRLFSALPAVNISEGQTVRFLNGGALSLERIKGLGNVSHRQRVRVCSHRAEFLGLGAIDRELESLKVLKLFVLA